ncbi:MAG: hypothetical protein MI757_13595 [Pirellulales bacterium]|nr:hypothetical protein [Pirellulales bacterium]
MPDSNCQGAVATPSIDELPCLVQLPEGWFDERGEHTAPMEHDQRRFPRRACGSSSIKAALEYQTTLPTRPRDSITWAVYPVSVSRGGLALLHSEPLYPCEKLRLTLADGKTYEVEVARCRRIGPRCFEIGVRF